MFIVLIFLGLVIPYAYRESIEPFYKKLEVLSPEEYGRKKAYYKFVNFLLSALIPMSYFSLCLFGFFAKEMNLSEAFLFTLITLPVIVVISFIWMWYKYMHRK
jgi:hypothetical protein